MKKEICYAVGDLETDPFKKGRMDIKPFCAGFHDGKITELFWGADCVEKFIERAKKFNGIIYFHNGGNFDFHFLLEYLPYEDCKFLCIGKRIVQIKTPWGCEFRDSFAIIPKALAAFHKTKIDYAWFERNKRERYKKQIMSYLSDDLKDSFAMVGGFLKRFPPAITLASSTFKILQKDYLAGIERSTANYDSMMRPFYFGGRVQFWQLGRVKDKHHTVDINSAYPWAMTLPHAHGTDFEISTKLPKKHFEQSFFVISCHSYGDLPLRNEKGGVDFPIGTNQFFVSGWELKAVMDLKLIKNLVVYQCFKPTEIKDFEKFVKDFYHAKAKAKRDGDTEEEFFMKIALNGSYGKMALNARNFTEVCLSSFGDVPASIMGKTKKQRKINYELSGWAPKWDDPIRGITFHARSSYREGIDTFVNVATAASITGCVRAFLIRSKAKCKGVVYCDTDSLTAADVSKLRFSDQLGDWKMEMIFAGTREDNSLWIAGKKLYAGQGYTADGKRKWKIASKGVRLTPEQIIDVAKGEEREHEAIAPTYSVFSPPKFVKRKIRRADRR